MEMIVTVILNSLVIALEYILIKSWKPTQLIFAYLSPLVELYLVGTEMKKPTGTNYTFNMYRAPTICMSWAQRKWQVFILQAHLNLCLAVCKIGGSQTFLAARTELARTMKHDVRFGSHGFKAGKRGAPTSKCILYTYYQGVSRVLRRQIQKTPSKCFPRKSLQTRKQTYHLKCGSLQCEGASKMWCIGARIRRWKPRIQARWAQQGALVSFKAMAKAVLEVEWSS